jgi:hydroxypyruvate isomerase
MPVLTKSQKRHVRELAAEAHARELGSALTTLYKDFQRWGDGEISVFDLNHLVHEFHNGVSRELYKRYVVGSVELGVMYALRQSVLTADEVGRDLVAALGVAADE